MIFSGGGMNTAHYAGIIRCLEKYDIMDSLKNNLCVRDKFGIKGCGGTSGGALYALFVVLGLKYDEIYSILTNVNIKDIGQVWNPQGIKNFVNLMGFNQGDVLKRSVLFALNKAFPKVDSEKLTLRDLYDLTQCHFGSVRVDIVSGVAEVINDVDYPNEKVIDAVVDSMRIPPYVSPRETSDGKKVIDGGVLLNFPFEEIFHQQSKTFGVRFSCNQPPQITNPLEFGLQLFRIMQDHIERMEYESYDPFYRTVNILTLSANPSDSINFLMTMEQIMSIVEKGFSEMESFLKRRSLIVQTLIKK